MGRLRVRPHGVEHRPRAYRGAQVAIRIVRLGTDRLPGEGPRLGTVRRPPRGILKTEYASKNFYDVWLPTLAPSAALVKQALTARSERDWKRFVTKYRRELAATNESATLDTLAALSHRADFSVGCYCADESRCHRSVLRELLVERGAQVK
jgi:uncharacterized protein YeaO (DUF488 family)